MQQLTVPAPAKLNLSLDIVGTREDGYHLLEMVLQTIDLCDELELRPAREISLACDRPELPCGRRNLAYRAAEAFFGAARISGGVQIRLTKRIPHGAGMGGGSADAAAVLRGLNRLFDAGLSAGELCSIGLRLGADVPFCILGGTMLAEGVGEKLTPLPPLPDCLLLVAKPAEGISTPEAYRAYDALEGVPHPDTAGLLAALERGDLSSLCGKMGNVLEAAAQLPAIGEIRSAMRASGALGSRMTGSGSAVFGVFDSSEQAQRCKINLEKKYSEVYLCRPLQKLET